MRVPGLGRLRTIHVRRHWKFVLCLAMVCCLLCVWMQAHLHEITDGYRGLSFIPNAVYDPFGSATAKQCDANVPRVPIPTAAAGLTTGRTEPLVCYYDDSHVCNDVIQMEDEWGRIGVGYPNLVLTVTGWVDTIVVDDWAPKPLTVIIMPHSHQDPGWLNTFEAYYSSSSRPTLSLMVSKLAANPTWKFVWAEVAFLQLWWNDASSRDRETFKRLLSNGQLEILTGGWVMTDEATSHYAAMLDQLSEGHLWLKTTLDRGRNRKTSVFTHMMPFLSYSIPHSCGPDRHVCCKFDFQKAQCFYGKAKVKSETVNDKNIAMMSRELWEQLQKKSELFRSDVLLIPHGDDFRYSGAQEWDAQFGNLGKIMSYINNNADMNMKIEFGTLADYFTSLHKSHKGPMHQDYPVLTGDFLPYSDRSDQYWSGFYTTRPYCKRMIRRLQSRLRSTELLYTFALSKLPVSENSKTIYARLVEVRRTLALMQHHDAITGTSNAVVVVGYLHRIRSAITSSQQAQEEIVNNILTDWYPKHNMSHVVVTLAESYENETAMIPRTLIEVDEQRIYFAMLVKSAAGRFHTYGRLSLVLVWNPLGVSRHDVVTLLVRSDNVDVTDDTGSPAKSQLSPVFDEQMNVLPEKYYLSFEVTVGPLSLTKYILRTISVLSPNAFVTITLFNMESFDTRVFQSFKAKHSKATFFHSTNEYMNATFSSCDGMLKHTEYLKEKTAYRSEVYFVTYSTGRHTHPFRDKSGAYIFLPDGPAKMLETDKPRILVLNGHLSTQVYVITRSILQIVTLFNMTGPLGKGLLIENVVQMKDKHWDNTELAMRLETDVLDTKHTFCHDLNGFQMHKRQTRPKLEIQGNYYPMTTMAILDGDERRVTLITTEAHGVASLVSGWLEVMLDRRLVQDDWRGLRQGVTDNRPTRSTFFLMFEKRRDNMKVPDHGHMCYPSTDANHIADVVNNPLSTFILDKIDAYKSNVAPSKSLLSVPLRCGMHIVNFKSLFNADNQSSPHKEALLTMHRKQLDCAFAMTGTLCLTQRAKSLIDLHMKIVSVEEMTISGSHRNSVVNTPMDINVDMMEINTYKIAFR